MSGLELILILNTTMILANLTTLLIFGNNLFKGMKDYANKH
jgi:hypothetical protein